MSGDAITSCAGVFSAACFAQAANGSGDSIGGAATIGLGVGGIASLVVALMPVFNRILDAREKRIDWQKQVEDLKKTHERDASEAAAKLVEQREKVDRLMHLVSVMVPAIQEDRDFIDKATRLHPDLELPRNYRKHEFDRPDLMFGIMSGPPSPAVVDVIEGRASLPTQRPADRTPAQQTQMASEARTEAETNPEPPTA